MVVALSWETVRWNSGKNVHSFIMLSPHLLFINFIAISAQVFTLYTRQYYLVLEGLLFVFEKSAPMNMLSLAKWGNIQLLTLETQPSAQHKSSFSQSCHTVVESAKVFCHCTAPKASLTWLMQFSVNPFWLHSFDLQSGCSKMFCFRLEVTSSLQCCTAVAFFHVIGSTDHTSD